MSNLTQQHTSDNDFLVGDTIILKDGKTILTVEHVWGDGCVWCHDGSMYESHEVEHATLEQMEANKHLIPSNNRELESMGDDAYIENHVSPLCIIDKKKQVEPPQTEVTHLNAEVTHLNAEVTHLNAVVERQKAEMVVMQARIDELTAENVGLHKAAATHFRNQNHYMDLYHKLVCELYPYALDLAEPVVCKDKPKDYIDGYNRSGAATSVSLLEMMQGDEKYIRMQCDMLGDEA